MSKFEDRLWDEVIRAHGDNLATMTRPAALRGRRARPGLIAGTSLSVAAAGAALAITLTATTTPPAFAVTRNHDGTVTVTVAGYSGIAGANAKLRQLGIRAEVMARVPRGCSMHGSPAPSQGIAGTRWTINPRKVPAGQTLILTAAARSGGAALGGRILNCHTTRHPLHGAGAPSPGAG